MKPVLAALPVALTLAAPLSAQELLDNSVEALRMQAAVRGPATTIPPSNEYPDPYIEARANGYYYLMILVGCLGLENCEQAEFSASFTVDSIDLEFLNSWNAANRIGTAYAEDNATDEVLLSHTVFIDPQMSVTAFREILAFWIDTMDDFSEALYGPPIGHSK